MLERTDSSSEIVLVPYEDAYAEGFEEIGCRRPDLSHIHRVIGWEPHHTIDDMIDSVISYSSESIAAVPMDVNETV